MRLIVVAMLLALGGGLAIAAPLASIAHADGNAQRAVPVIAVSPDVPEATRTAIARLQSRGMARVEVADTDEVPTEEELVGPARLAYGKMDFPRALKALESAEHALIDGKRASPLRVTRLAGLEAFWGACLLLERDRVAAAERFALARALDRHVRADPMFPPEVASALSSTRAEPLLPLVLDLAPPDARAWIDGRPATEHDRVPVGLHYLVVERADRRPAATLARISASSTRVALGALAPADSTNALATFADPSLPDTERIAVSALVGAPVWRVTMAGGAVVAARYSAADIVEQARTFAPAEVQAETFEHTFCAVEPCALAPAAVHRVPLRRRAWFWGAIGGGIAIVLGGVIAGAVVATSPRSFNAVVR